MKIPMPHTLIPCPSNRGKASYALLLTFAVCSIAHGADSFTNLLSFHLLADTAGWKSIIGSTGRLANVKLVPEPVLSDHDFVSYDTTNHIFVVTAEAAKRVSRKMMKRDTPSVTTRGEKVYHLDGPDTPFVLVVSGERTCFGVFSSPISSIAYSDPTIWGEHLVIPAESTNNFSFMISPYSSGEWPDQRKDSRFLAAVKKLSL